MNGSRLGPGSATLRRARWTEGSSAPPCGRRYIVVRDGLSSTCWDRVGADDESLQLAGDGVIAAVMQRVDGATELARGTRGRPSGSEAGTGMMSWPRSLRLSSAAGRQRRWRACPSISRSWAASSRATRSASGAASISRIGEVWSQAAIDYVLETGEKTRQQRLMIPSGGWRCTGRAHARATGTWSCSSRPWRIPAGPRAWLS